MKAFQQIIDDIKRGENIDLYFLIVAAIIVAALNLFSITSQNLVATVSLAMFALIASAILGNRHRLERIQKSIGDSSATKILEKYPRDQLNEDVMAASEIWFFGVHLIGMLRYHRDTIESRLRKGKTIRALIVDPNGSACIMAAARNPGSVSLMVERERASISATLSDLCELKRIAPDKLEIKIIDDPLMYGGCLIDPDSINGKIYIHRYSYQTGIRPKFIWERNDEWFDFIKSELNSLWSRGSIYSCENSAAVENEG